MLQAVVCMSLPLCRKLMSLAHLADVAGNMHVTGQSVSRVVSVMFLGATCGHGAKHIRGTHMALLGSVAESTLTEFAAFLIAPKKAGRGSRQRTAWDLLEFAAAIMGV